MAGTHSSATPAGIDICIAMEKGGDYGDGPGIYIQGGEQTRHRQPEDPLGSQRHRLATSRHTRNDNIDPERVRRQTMPIITKLRRKDLADIREAYAEGIHKAALKKQYHISQLRLQAILGDAWQVGSRALASGVYADNFHVEEDIPGGEEQIAPRNGITFLPDPPTTLPAPTAPPAESTAPPLPAEYVAAFEARVLEFRQLLKEKDATHEQELRAKDARYEQLEMQHTKLLSEYQQTVFRQQNWTGPATTMSQSLGNGG
jgi:hypothetical protein